MGYIWPSKPVLYLPFDEGRGNKAYDQSEYKNDGTIYGATWVKGKFGYALSFDGVDDYVKVSYSEIFDSLVNEITIAAWVNIYSFPSSGIKSIVQRGYWDPETGSFLFAVHSTEKFYFYIADGTTARELKAFTPELNKWYYAVATAKLPEFMRIYVNGELVGEITDLPINEINKLTKPIDVGTNRWHGIIDEVRIYNRALTPLEIKKLYYIGKLAKEYLG